MAQSKSARFTKEQISAIEDMDERDMADTESEAHRMLVNAGMREYGYRHGEYGETVLKTFVERLARLLTITGMIGLGFTFAYPVPARVPSFAVLAFGVFLYGVHDALEKREPDVSKRLKRLVGRSSA